MPGKHLAHHGILGMKWGVRRFQNADGTLTAAGKRRKNQESHNDTLSYRVGAKRLNKRLGKMERGMTSDLASVRRQRQYSIGQRSLVRKETESVLDSPSRVTAVGKATIKGRTLSTLGALSASGAAFYASAAMSTTMPLSAIPISAISAGYYWYKSMS